MAVDESLTARRYPGTFEKDELDHTTLLSRNRMGYSNSMYSSRIHICLEDLAFDGERNAERCTSAKKIKLYKYLEALVNTEISQ